MWMWVINTQGEKNQSNENSGFPLKLTTDYISNILAVS